MKRQLLPIIFVLTGLASGIPCSQAQILDSLPPIISLNPGINVIELACDNMPYTDPGATAIDNKPPFNLTSAIVVTSNVNTRRPGKYFVSYMVQDVYGNKAYALRSVVVTTTKKHGFEKARISNDLDLYFTNAEFEIARTAYQWYVDGVKQGEKNGMDSLYIFHDSAARKITMEEWFCGEDTAISHQLDNDTPHVNAYVRGRVNVDYNRNCQADKDEPGAEMRVNLVNNASVVIATVNSSFGQFAFYDVDPGTYTVQPFIVGNQQAFLCNPKEAMIDVLPHSASEGTVFNLQCGTYQDVGIKGVIAVGAVPGQFFRLMPVIGLDNFYRKLKCDTGKVPGTVKIAVKGKATYLKPGAGALTPDKVSNKIFTYDVDDFNKISENAFDLNFFMDTSATMNDKLEVEVWISGLRIDVDSGNNHYKSEVPVRTSYDPNLVVLEPSVVAPNYDKPVVHSIHFQNTGTAEAYNIRVMDTLDMKFDPATFELLANSHPVKYIIRGQALNFYFPNIMLADSFSNEPASHGWVTFRVKPKQAFAKSEVAYNQAHIYFDYNAPVSTNTADVKVVEEQQTGIFPGTYGDQLKVYPNPANGMIQVEYTTGSGVAQMEIFSMQGVRLGGTEIRDGKCAYNTAGLDSGMYVIRISENGQYSYRLVQIVH